jgi:hypothetical protein
MSCYTKQRSRLIPWLKNSGDTRSCSRCSEPRKDWERRRPGKRRHAQAQAQLLLARVARGKANTPPRGGGGIRVAQRVCMRQATPEVAQWSCAGGLRLSRLGQPPPPARLWWAATSSTNTARPSLCCNLTRRRNPEPRFGVAARPNPPRSMACDGGAACQWMAPLVGFALQGGVAVYTLGSFTRYAASGNGASRLYIHSFWLYIWAVRPSARAHECVLSRLGAAATGGARRLLAFGWVQGRDALQAAVRGQWPWRVDGEGGYKGRLCPIWAEEPIGPSNATQRVRASASGATRVSSGRGILAGAGRAPPLQLKVD